MKLQSDSRRILVAHPSPDLYGSDRVLLEDVKGLLQAQWQVTVALPAEGPLAQALRPLGADVVISTTPVLRKAIFTPRGALTFLKDFARSVKDSHLLLTRLRPEAVVVNTTIIPLWVVFARITGYQVILHVHESERHAPAPMRLALSLPGTFTHKVITNSRYTNEAYLQYVPWVRKKSHVVLNGIPGPPQTESPRAELVDAVRLVYVGRLSERKGLLVVLEAIGLLQNRGIDLQLSIVGAVFPGYEWFETKLREEISRLPKPEQVQLLGFQSTVWPHYNSADIALIPSMMEESFGNTAVEAVLAGRPAVVSRIGGLEEAVEGLTSAILVSPGDAEELADGIERIIGNWETFQKNTADSIAIAKERHNPEQFGKHIEAIVRSALSSR